ncbi:hypothetical protein [Paractinoplanes maris]|uniref:hypothetical protein n=1 Tax=Paractinoplanes maris TaxID=1734446 RepID=UPI0020220975|nr:hypothetical protein [Actinoplanes maris]
MTENWTGTAAVRLRTLGLITVIASLIGAACAVAVLAWPPQVGTDWYSYPFDATGYAVAQSFFALHHIGILVGLYGLARLAWPRASRSTKAGLVIAAVGMVLLMVCELFAITAAKAQVGTPAADAVDNAYGAPMILIGAGMVLAGVGLVRRPVFPGWGRWIPLVLGIYVFVPLFPAVFGPMVLGRIAIGVWFAIFAALGVALMRAGTVAVPTDSGRPAGEPTGVRR